MMRNTHIVCGIVLGGMLVPAAFAQPAGTAYVATSWNQGAVVYLDSNFQQIGAFAFGGNPFPNGIAVNPAGEIYAGVFTPNNTVYAYDYNGGFLFNWNDPNSFNLQGMEYMLNGNVAIANASEIRFHDAATGLLNGTIPNPAGSDTEGLAYDPVNNIIFALATDIWALDASNGNMIYTIPNPAVNNSFTGTGITYLGNDVLAIGTVEGDWYVIDSVTGNLLDFGNNGVDMYGLKVIPAPGSLVMLAAGGLLAARRRR